MINEIDIEKSGRISRHPNNGAIATDTYLRRIALRILAISADWVHFRERAAINVFYSIDLSRTARFWLLIYRGQTRRAHSTPFSLGCLSELGIAEMGSHQHEPRPFTGLPSALGGRPSVVIRVTSMVRCLSTPSFHPCVTTDRPSRACICFMV